MLEQKRLLEALGAGVCSLVFIASQVFGRNEVWLIRGQVCKVLAALMLIALFAQWEVMSRNRRILEVGTKLVFCLFSGMIGLALARLSTEMTEEAVMTSVYRQFS